MTIHPDPYVVRKNDTLWGIAYSLYGRPSLWEDLAHLNGISNPSGLRTGTALRVAADGLRRYRVQKNDTYYELAAKRLGSHQRWPELARLNPQLGSHQRWPELARLNPLQPHEIGRAHV